MPIAFKIESNKGPRFDKNTDFIETIKQFWLNLNTASVGEIAAFKTEGER